ncbi:hypothetical protein IX39_20375 [Chryseobacterium formosense]|uniref:TIR domain-containing protein n=1 Tax=Chryseobacterium formosense TaxID=236814 RepID=A0A085YYU0_9FLAO|nr:TIR domain-containing protein [Chryseobacterium formosense]KFE97353.1 hypothetical protein IX39_20375 [Chryseobacterium formosense]SFT91376.1 WD40 repeat [Chryseobacterium formosense]
MLKAIKKYIFGYDIFISYSRKDSLGYAYSVAKYFMKKGFNCYIDQLSNITPGTQLPLNIKNAIERSTAFILIGSVGAQNSEAIEQEIKLFLTNSRNKPLIPITIDGAINSNARWYENIIGLALVNETLKNLQKSEPTQDVFDRIENALNFTKKSKQLRIISLLIVVMIVLITSAATYYTFSAIQTAQIAESKKITADILKNRAINQKKLATTQMLQANKTRDLFELQKKIALKDKNNAEIQKNISDKIAKANSLASSSSNALDSDPTRSFIIANEAIKIFPTDEAHNALFKAYIFAPFYKTIPGSFVKIYPNGKNIAVMDNFGVISIYDWQANKSKLKYKLKYGFDPQSYDWQISDDNSNIIINSKNSSVPYEIINLATGNHRILNKLIPDKTEKILRISNDGKKLVTLKKDRVIFYNINNTSIVKEKEMSNLYLNPENILFAPDNKIIAMWNKSTILVQNYQSQKKILYKPFQENITEVVFSENNDFDRLYSHSIYFSSKKGDYLFNFDPRVNSIDSIDLREIVGERSSVNRGIEKILFSKKTDDYLITQYYSTTPIVGSINNLFPEYSLMGGHSSDILCGAFSNDGKWVLTGGEDNVAIIWQKKKIRHILKGHFQPIIQVVISDDKKKALSVGYNENIKIWNLDIQDNRAYKDNIDKVFYNQKTGTYFVENVNTYLTPKQIMKYLN